ncbi:MAG: four helix bundle protein [Bacteroidales bacterium]
MATIEKFEDLEVWKKARELCKLIHKYTLKDSFAKDFSLKDQIKRSSGSVMDNIAEGFDRGGKKEFIQFLFISKSSSSETKSQLYRALDYGYINQEEFEVAYNKCSEIASMETGLINYLKNSPYKGKKHI